MRPASIVPPGESHAFVVADDGTRLFVRSRPAKALGPVDRPTVVLCDGILCDGFIWKYLWDDLAERYPVAHWHYRGHGRSASPGDAERIGVEAHAEDLAVVREHLGAPGVVLVGHSMGTQVVLEHYRRHPEGVKALVLVCGSFGKVTSTFRGLPVLDLILPKVMDLVDKQPELMRAVWSRIPVPMALKIALKTRDVDPDRIREEDLAPYLQHMTHMDLPMFLRMLRGAGEHTAEDMLGDVKVPVLVVAGERDTFTPAMLSERMAEAIPDAELLMLAGGSHAAPLEQHELVRDRILALCDRVSAP